MKKQKLFDFLVLLAVTVLFCILVCFVDVAAIGPAGTKVGFSHLNGWFRDLIGTNMVLYRITNLLGYLALLVCCGFAFMGGMQLLQGKSLKKVDRNIIAVGVFYVIIIALYLLFEKVAINYRPIIMPGEDAPEASFPSSHTMLALTVFGSAPWIMNRYLKDANVRKIFTAVCWILGILTVVLRLLSGVHWLTDIIAGFLISATLLAGFKIVLAQIKPKKKA